MRIIFKPYSLKDKSGVPLRGGGQCWRCETDFPATRSGKHLYGKGIDKMSALADLMSWCHGDLLKILKQRTEGEMFPMPDQYDFTFWQLNLDGYKPSKKEWLYIRQYWNTFKNLPSEADISIYLRDNA